MKKQYLTMVLMLTSLSAFAQKGSIKGKIIEQSTKQPIAGAAILLKDAGAGALTDTSGVFVIKDVLEGNYTLKISMIGFQEKTINDVFVVRNKTCYFEAELLEGLELMNEVVVTAFKNENDPMAPVSSYSFGREEIFRNPGAQGDIFRAIGILPGVSSSGGQFSAIAVRGQGVRDNVYMVDDIPMFEVSHLEGNGAFNDPNGGRFSIFAPRIIDNATFQGGGFAAQFGRKSSSYLGLNIKEGSKETPSLSGQFDLLGATVMYDGPVNFLKKTSAFVTARYQNFALLASLIGLKHIGLPSYGDYMIKTTTDINEKNKLSVLVMYNPDRFIRDVDLAKKSPELEDNLLARSLTSKATIGLNLRTLTTEKSYWKNILYYRTMNTDTEIGSYSPSVNSEGVVLDKDHPPYEPDLQKLKTSQDEIGLRSFFIQHFNKITVTTGVDIARVSMSSSRDLKHLDTLYSFTANDIRPDASQYFLILPPSLFNTDYKNFSYNTSGYLDLSFAVIKSLTINSGIRYDYTGFTKQYTFSPRLSGSLALSPKQSLNFATGIFYQDPLYQDIADQPDGNRLKNEKTTQYILGYKNYWSEDLKFILETWYKKFEDLTLRPQSGQAFLTNNGTGLAYGADVNVTKRLSKKYYGQIGYSYMQSKRDDHNGDGQYNFTYSQPHMISLLASYKPNARWSFAVKFRYATGRPKDSYVIHSNVFNDPAYFRYSQEITGKNTDRLNDYISLDPRIEYRMQTQKLGLTAFVDIVNILNRYNQSSEGFQEITGKTYYDGLGIFPSFGLRMEL